MKAALLLVVLVLACGCQPMRVTSAVMEAQRPGEATGAGARLLGPANSSQASTQVAERVVEWAMPVVEVPVPQPVVPVVDVGGAVRREVVVQPAAMPVPGPRVAQPVRVSERVTTSLGSHQDAAGIIAQAAKLVEGFSTVQWIGLGCLLLGFGGLLHAAGNEATGYPACWMLVAAVGLVLLVTGNGWLLFAAAVPAGLYFGQKFGILRIPPIP